MGAGAVNLTIWWVDFHCLATFGFDIFVPNCASPHPARLSYSESHFLFHWDRRTFVVVQPCPSLVTPMDYNLPVPLSCVGSSSMPIPWDSSFSRHLPHAGIKPRSPCISSKISLSGAATRSSLRLKRVSLSSAERLFNQSVSLSPSPFRGTRWLHFEQFQWTGGTLVTLEQPPLTRLVLVCRFVKSFVIHSSGSLRLLPVLADICLFALDDLFWGKINLCIHFEVCLRRKGSLKCIVINHPFYLQLQIIAL